MNTRVDRKDFQHFNPPERKILTTVLKAEIKKEQFNQVVKS